MYKEIAMEGMVLFSGRVEIIIEVIGEMDSKKDFNTTPILMEIYTPVII